MTLHNYRSLFSGLDVPVPLLNGKQQVYINLDNAASTPPLKAVEEAVQRFLPYYSSVHRGTGFKSQLSTHAYESARRKVLTFLGAREEEHICIFGKNTTEMINRLAKRFPFTPERDTVIVSLMEHHSNDLPWRGVAKVLRVGLLPDGRLNEAHFDALLEQYGSRVALVAISGASNVTGYLNPIHRLAEKAHRVGAQIMVDAAQLAPHRAIHMLPLEDPAHLDYVVLSAHKMYAPFGTGALVGRKDTFSQGEPDHRGGGQVEFVTEEDVEWTGAPERDEAGSPNTIGAVALAAAMDQLMRVGMDEVARHEAELTAYALEKLNAISWVRLFGDRDPQRAAERLGVLPIQIEGVPHFLAAAVLGYEFGIGVRSGCFCAHPYLLHLLEISPADAARVRKRILKGDRREMPGMIRASFGLYNTTDEIDALIEALAAIRRGDYEGVYYQDVATGEYHPEGWAVRFEDYFTFEG